MDGIEENGRARGLAIDPGSIHTGLALFEGDGPDSWECVRAWELLPDEAADYVAACLAGRLLDFLIWEKWQLYPDKAPADSPSLDCALVCVF